MEHLIFNKILSEISFVIFVMSILYIFNVIHHDSVSYNKTQSCSWHWYVNFALWLVINYSLMQKYYPTVISLVSGVCRWLGFGRCQCHYCIDWINISLMLLFMLHARYFLSSIITSKFLLPIDKVILTAKSFQCINGNRPEQNGCHFSDHIFKYTLLNENYCIFIQISLNFVRNGPIDNKSALVEATNQYLNQCWRNSNMSYMVSVGTQWDKFYCLHCNILLRLADLDDFLHKW